ncbi:MAG: ATP-binding protein [Prolixibacteraceae bacterium]|jgi:signal transduction histidine kinase/ligand-binding sensor domain-containing protein/DNA-binding response OmpR family regulator|nr:ATP-binding protein [Prolixibacteraceae bacterium]
MKVLFKETSKIAGFIAKQSFLFAMCLYLLSQVPLFAYQSELTFDGFSQEEGLSNNQVQCIYQDRQGWIWIGTSQGVNRYDGYNFVNFLYSPNDSMSLKGSLVRVIFEDRTGALYVGTENGTINRYNRNNQTFDKPFDDHPYFLDEVSINDICQDDDGVLWVATHDNILLIYPDGEVTLLSDIARNLSVNIWGNFVRELSFDNTGRLWAGTNEGVFIIDPITKEIEEFNLPLSTGTTDEIWEIYSDAEGVIWIGTYMNGLFAVDPVTLDVDAIVLEPEIDRTETVRTLSTDSYGQLWIGTRGGLFIYRKNIGTVGFYRHDDRKPGSLINNSVLDVFHDRTGESWIGTRGGLNLLAKSKQAFKNFSAQPANDKYLNSSIVYAFWVDGDGKIWVGTEDGGVNIFNPDTESYTYMTANSEKQNSLSRNCIKAFKYDGKSNLWIGSFWGGVDILNIETGEITNLKHEPGNRNSISDNKVMDIETDDEGFVWVANWGGIDRIDPVTLDVVRFAHISGGHANWVKLGLDNNLWIGTPREVVVYNLRTKNVSRFDEYTRSVYFDSKERIWLATVDKGLALYSLPGGALKYYDQSNGLANNQALCILEDSDNDLWVSTTNGLSCFDPATEVFLNYNSHNGLLNNQFSYGAAYEMDDGRMIFGGISGFNIFNPVEVKRTLENAPLVFTDFKIFNKSVLAGSESDVLPKSINQLEELVLGYDQKVITFEFAALNYVNSNRNLYSYYLEGFETTWNEPSALRSATYTNLDPGDYLLKVKRVLPGGNTNENVLTLSVTILPPYWKTTWFRAILLLVIMSLVFALMQVFLYRERIKNELVLERMKAKKLHELDMLKLKFFTNISHEIRTPLSLILAPLKKLKQKTIPSNEVDSHIDIMYRNTKQLDRLINQLLDFRKLETGNLKLELLEGDIIRFFSEVIHSFDDLANDKDISLKFNAMHQHMVARFDPDKLEKIVNNLLSNAFKFTSKGGRVTVNLSTIFADDDSTPGVETDKQFIELSVRDTGQGISQKHLSKIFNRFFRATDREEQTGTGLGLAFVKDLVQLHSGKIYVESKEGKGSKFTVRIPYLKPESESLPANVSNRIDKNDQEDDRDIARISSKILLIVEDNPDVRALLRSHFQSKFRIEEATNGKEGWEATLETVPDVIISDILMPDIDGYEFCSRVKKDERTSHIPVLLLTALHSLENEKKGLACGADDYITKPFDLSILETKIDNMLEVREALKQRYNTGIRFEPKYLAVESPDEKFLVRVMDVVESNMSNSQLDIEQFALEVGVSRMQLYRKLNALTNMTVKEFIRDVRLKRAAQLLGQNKMNISEVAYAVGFKDLSHFRKCFRQLYGMSASEYLKTKQK